MTFQQTQHSRRINNLTNTIHNILHHQPTQDLQNQLYNFIHDKHILYPHSYQQ